MKKRDLLNLYNALTSIEGKAFTTKFNYFIAINKSFMRDEIDALEMAKKPDPKFVEYDIERAKLAHEMADKDSNGQAIVENNNFIITEKFEEFKEALINLKSKYSKAIEDQEKIDFKDIPSEIKASILETFIIANLIIEENQE